MFIPYGTDAPIYYYPFATIGMIVLNVFVYLTMLSALSNVPDGEPPLWLLQIVLQYGHGLRPWQWITSNFVHDGFFHLLGNMVSLWTFGLVVEGKVGWLRFLA